MKRNGRKYIRNLIMFLGLMIMLGTIVFFLGFEDVSAGGFMSALTGLLIMISISSLVGAGYTSLILISDRHREHNMIVQTMLTREEIPGEISSERSHNDIQNQAESYRRDIIAIENALAA